MKIDRNEAFRELTPPAGGAARMRARLANEARSSYTPSASWASAGAGAAAFLLIAGLVAFAFRAAPGIEGGSPGIAGTTGDPRQGELYASADLDRLLGRASMPLELVVSSGDRRFDLIEIPTRDPQVRFVRIEASPAN